MSTKTVCGVVGVFLAATFPAACSGDNTNGSDSGGPGNDSAVLTDSSTPDVPFVPPTNHPFISLRDYENAGTSSAAFTTLKTAVDDAVAVTAALPSTAKYADLSSALSSDHYGFSCADSIVMYHLTGDAKYLAQALKMVDLFVTSENALITGGNDPTIAGDSYLDVGGLLEQVALAYDYGYDKLTSDQRTAWETYANQAITNVWNATTAKWGTRSAPWSGWATSDPGDNYYYSFMKATMLWALANQNQTWRSYLEATIFPATKAYFASMIGGGSREGTGYGTALKSLFENYAYWHSSTGEDLAGQSPHARDTIDYWIHASTPTLEYFASIGDQARSSMTAMFDYQRVLVLEDVSLNAGTTQSARGNWWLNHIGVTDGGNGWVQGRVRYNFDYRYDLLQTTQAEQAPTDLSYYAQGAGVLFARSGWNTTDSWIATVAGIYDQSHAHQDQGSFQLFKGTWLSATSNLYSNSGLHQETGAHNVLRFDKNGAAIPQTNSTSTMTHTDSADTLQVNETLTPAYATSSGAVTSWVRQLTYTRSAHTLDVHDTCAVGSGVTPVFQVHVPAKPTVSGSIVTAGTLKITQILPAVNGSNAPQVVSMPSVDSDFQSGYRIELRGAGCEFHVTLQAN